MPNYVRQLTTNPHISFFISTINKHRLLLKWKKCLRKIILTFISDALNFFSIFIITIQSFFSKDIFFGPLKIDVLRIKTRNVL